MALSLRIVAILMGIDGHRQVSLTVSVTDTFVLNHPAVSCTVIIFIYIIVAGFACSWGPIPWLYCSEIYPVTMRAKAISLTTAANWTTNSAVSFLIPLLLEFTTYGTFIIFSIFCAIISGLVYISYRETKHKDLEETGIHERQTLYAPTSQRNKTDYDSYS
jgi:hypothetical protein